MAKRLLLAVSVACFAYVVERCTPAAVVLTARSQSAGNRGDVKPQSSDSLKVILLGTGVGPRVDLLQFGPATLIEAGAERLLFDCGRPQPR